MIILSKKITMISCPLQMLCQTRLHLMNIKRELILIKVINTQMHLQMVILQLKLEHHQKRQVSIQTAKQRFPISGKTAMLQKIIENQLFKLNRLRSKKIGWESVIQRIPFQYSQLIKLEIQFPDALLNCYLEIITWVHSLQKRQTIMAVFVS